MMERAQQCIAAVMDKWLAVAQSLSALETRYMLQVDDFRRRSRWRLLKTLTCCWHSEAACAKQMTRRARLTKVFACWRLCVQETILLRKYLSECSEANFRADGVAGTLESSSQGSVQLADFEHIYIAMAAQRWDAVDVMSD
eukprot:CAMPEP_0179185340 /NCGR_PEP_ID=MMETSP0796-20121207/91903_1 /TAXON_ID=73915 /ORGANISM="Pyrodinium bahamense, Strain pbaha01" /LENGTH=140 /DNA_ID=CAMNT_0020889295 /DNA_START=20 /DNA_END=445 /DNA_ORIENTATION=-